LDNASEVIDSAHATPASSSTTQQVSFFQKEKRDDETLVRNENM
jgi:hypothetical protein